MKQKLISFFILIVSLCVNLKAQNFKPADPDTAKINGRFQISDSFSKAEIYLAQNYISQAANRDSIRHYSGDGYYGVCGYSQKYLHGIRYSLNACDEDGGWVEQHIYFPKMQLKDAQKLIEKLFYDLENTWETENRYAPNGVGCYYKIIQTSRQTIIHNYCGC